MYAEWYGIRTHVSLLMDMPLAKPTQHHLGVELVQDFLHARNTSIDLAAVACLVSAVVADEIEELGVQIVKALVRARGAPAKGHQRASGERVLGRTFVERRLVIVRKVVH